jgi:hypothetical protein
MNLEFHFLSRKCVLDPFPRRVMILATAYYLNRFTFHMLLRLKQTGYFAYALPRGFLLLETAPALVARAPQSERRPVPCVV